MLVSFLEPLRFIILFTKISILLNFSIDFSYSKSKFFSSDKSTATPNILSLFLPIWFNAVCTLSSDLPCIINLQSSFDKALERDNPIPLVEPVIKTFLP